MTGAGVVVATWFALAEPRLEKAGKGEPDKDFGLSATDWRPAGDSIRLHAAVFFRVRNVGLRSGYVERCELAPIRLSYMPTMGNTRVDRSKILPWRSQRVTCQFSYTMARNKAYTLPEWQLTFYSSDGSEVLNTRMSMPVPSGCRIIPAGEAPVVAGTQLDAWFECTDIAVVSES